MLHREAEGLLEVGPGRETKKKAKIVERLFVLLIASGKAEAKVM